MSNTREACSGLNRSKAVGGAVAKRQRGSDSRSNFCHWRPVEARDGTSSSPSSCLIFARKSHPTKGRMKTVIASGVLVVALAGCGGSKSPANAGTPASTPSTNGTSATASSSTHAQAQAATKKLGCPNATITTTPTSTATGPITTEDFKCQIVVPDYPNAKADTTGTFDARISFYDSPGDRAADVTLANIKKAAQAGVTVVQGKSWVATFNAFDGLFWEGRLKALGIVPFELGA
jgi:hypothetical protein